jgi:hypothetical protein
MVGGAVRHGGEILKWGVSQAGTSSEDVTLT